MSAYSDEDLEHNKILSQSLIKLYRLMKKQTLLVLLATMSTLIFWSLANIMYFYGSFLQVFVYIDISINCLCLWLMFAWNNHYYKKYCICAKILGGTIFKVMKNDEMKRVSALKNSIELHGGYHNTQRSNEIHNSQRSSELLTVKSQTGTGDTPTSPRLPTMDSAAEDDDDQFSDHEMP